MPTQPEPALCCRLKWVPDECWESKHAGISRDTPARVSMVSQCPLMPGWRDRLAEISTNLREAVAQLQVCYMLMRYTNSRSLYSTLLCVIAAVCLSFVPSVCLSVSRTLTNALTDDSVNNRPVKRLPLVARLSPSFYIGPHAGLNYGIVTQFYNLKLGSRLKCWPTWFACIHWKNKR